MEPNFLAIIIAFIFSLSISYYMIKAAVKSGTKEALKQTEYYLEIIAKDFHDKK